MLSLTRLHDRMISRFHDVEQVGESVIRFTRLRKDCPFAVYYVDISSSLPSTLEELTSYQDRVIGKRYFDGRKSLQWSTYLFFVVSDERSTTDAVSEARKLIEQDRTYARKSVITETELDSAIEPQTLEASDALPESNILSVWMRKITEAGLDSAVLSDDDLPTRLKLIVQSSTPSKPSATVPVAIEPGAKEPFLRSLKLTKFRDFPVRRFFEFGNVNLIVGVNGSGKTALLEAIELLYCGRNKRNKDDRAPYTIDVAFEDGSRRTVDRSRPALEFRKRNLAWYGQSEVQTNDLYQSFARFNFLDTDAAASLAISSKKITENLSKLLVGPQASNTWREIERMDDAVVAKLHELQPREAQTKEDLAAISARLNQTVTIKQESDSILERLEKMLQRAGSSMPTGEKEEVAGDLVEVLTESCSIARQAVEFEWAGSPVSLDGLKEYSEEVRKLCDKVEPDMARLEGLRKDDDRLANVSRRCQNAAKLVEETARFVDAGLPARAEEMRAQQGTITTNSGALVGLEDKVLAVLRSSHEVISVAEYVRKTESERAAAEKTLATTTEEHQKFTDLRDQSLELAQKLREIADQLLQSAPNPDQCPLCHNKFDSGELTKHMQLGVEEHVEGRAQVLLAGIRQCEDGLQAAALAESAADWLAQFCERSHVEDTDSVQSVLSIVESTQRALEDAERRSQSLKKELLLLEMQSISVIKLDELLGELSEIGYPLAVSTNEHVEQLRAKAEKEGAQASRALEELRKRADNLHKVIEASLAVTAKGFEDLKSAISQLKERRAQADGLREQLGGMFKTLPWRGDKALSELVVEAESIREVAAKFQAARAKENHARTILAEDSKQRAILQGRLSKLAPNIARLSRAHEVLESIREEHSLEDAMRTALNRNRSAIEAIFGRIHAPAEFSGLGKEVTDLIRKAGGKQAKLSEISTGQRAAFALSIFLAQNAQLRAAPPVLLIDDPIAHVDDLNSLCFLDYLREIALSGGRQIMFATASAKLAALFERKFDFLGDKDFRRFDLRR